MLYFVVFLFVVIHYDTVNLGKVYKPIPIRYTFPRVLVYVE